MFAVCKNLELRLHLRNRNHSKVEGKLWDCERTLCLVLDCAVNRCVAYCMRDFRLFFWQML
jgi:hypothetical protein